MENIDIDLAILENIDIYINKGILQNIDIDRISISIKYRIDLDLEYRTPLVKCRDTSVAKKNEVKCTPNYRHREDAHMEPNLNKEETFDHLRQCGFSEVSIITMRMSCHTHRLILFSFTRCTVSTDQFLSIMMMSMMIMMVMIKKIKSPDCCIR